MARNSRFYFLVVGRVRGKRLSCKMAGAEDLNIIRGVWTGALISDEVTKYLELELGIESVNQFVRFVKEKEYEDKWEEILKAKPDPKFKKLGLMVANVRQAYLVALKMYAKVHDPPSGLAEVEIEAPLGGARRLAVHGGWGRGSG